MIYYASPFSLVSSIGAAYNDFLRLLPHETDYACLVDGDTLFTTSDYGFLIAKAVEENPSCRLFYALTNRIGCWWQKVALPNDTDDIAQHRAYGSSRALKYGSSVVERQHESYPGSGFFILVRKDLWIELKGFREGCMLGVDHDFYRKAAKAKETILQLQGIYLYYWYKGSTIQGNVPVQRNTRHLNKGYGIDT